MRYQLGDEEVDPKRILKPRTANHRIAEVEGGESGAMAVVQNFVHGFRPHHLPRLREQTDRGAGYGHEAASSMFDDDLEPGDEPFEGVLITSNIRSDEVVMSRAAYKRLIDALLDLPPPE